MTLHLADNGNQVNLSLLLVFLQGHLAVFLHLGILLFLDFLLYLLCLVILIFQLIRLPLILLSILSLSHIQTSLSRFS